MIRYLAQSLVDTSNLPYTGADKDHLNGILNVVLGTMGALAFLMLVIAGFRYSISQGEPEKVAGARRMITYSIAGLVVIALAATIVNFVVKASNGS